MSSQSKNYPSSALREYKKLTLARQSRTCSKRADSKLMLASRMVAVSPCVYVYHGFWPRALSCLFLLSALSDPAKTILESCARLLVTPEADLLRPLAYPLSCKARMQTLPD
jgi:hypothetical protein